MHTTQYEEIRFTSNGNTYYLNAQIADYSEPEVEIYGVFVDGENDLVETDLAAFLAAHESDACECVLEHARDLWVDEQDRYEADAYDRHFDR
jgi:hypothetical protein